MTVEEVLTKMSVGEFNQWARFLAEEPPVADRIDLMCGVISSTIANVNRGRRATPFSPADFMPVLKARSEAEYTALSDEEKATRNMRDFFVAMGKAPNVRRH